ncbi:MAG: nicotinate-nicotinamide nucleotide adenylyltransferase [Candidatus Sumerlaeia bacterium]|nr:nicotinate-nicotinamide nucleotide adenylyltransferase [Candidatus Sumerlaeia bacterium]
MSTSPVIGIFGGSFDPFHRAHAMVVLWALQHSAIQKVLIVPTFNHAYGKEFGASYFDRIEMCRLGIREFTVDRVDVSTIEETLGGVSYMFHTIQALKKHDPKSEYRLLTGSDVFHDVVNWFRGEELLTLAPPLEIPRPLSPGDTRPGLLPNISSSEVRRRIRTGEVITDLVPALVEEHIRVNRLYHA